MKVNIDQFNEEKSKDICEVEVTDKACWRPEVRKTYNCKSGTFATYE